MPLADHNLLGIILDEHVAGRNLPIIKQYIIQIATCVKALHEAELCHGGQLLAYATIPCPSLTLLFR